MCVSLDGAWWPAADQHAVITAAPGWSFANACVPLPNPNPKHLISLRVLTI